MRMSGGWHRFETCATLWVGLLFLLLGACDALGAPAPIISRSEMMTVEEIRPGMKGVGKSVFRGTRVESFGVTVLGVLRRVEFDGDIILVRIESGPPVAGRFGVVSGMSGSPIYVGGKLIGALAYAWEFAKQPIAGVTPIAQMLEAYRPGSAPARREGMLRPAQPFLVSGERIERVVVVPSRAAVSSPAPHTATLVPVATPVLVSGLDPGAISLLRTALEPLGMIPLAGAGARGHVETRMVPGQAVGARLVGGDLDVTAIGTVTYVKDDVVLAFGHELSGLGTTELPLVAAYVHGVMPSAELSFKLVSAGQSLGQFTEDRPWCLGGRLGAGVKLIESNLEVSDRDREVVRRHHVEVIRNRMLTSLLLSAVLDEAISSVGPPTEGTTRVRLSIEAEGLPRLERENTYAVEEEQSGLLSSLLGPGGAASATEELSQILDVLQNSAFGEARINRLGMAVELSKRRRVARLEEASVARHKVKPGEEVEVGITLRAANGGRITRREKMRIPATCPPGQVRLGVAGGRSAESLRARLSLSYPRPDSMAQMVQQMLERPSNDDLVMQLALPTVGIEARGFVFRDLPPAAVDLLRSATATRLRALRDYVEERTKTEWVISGESVLTLTVEGEEKDKAGRPPSPEYQGPMFEEVGPGLRELFSMLGPAAARLGRSSPARRARLPQAGPSTSLRVNSGAPALQQLAEELELEGLPPMPSWEEVETVGERAITAPSLSEEPKPAGAERGEAIGRLASVWRLSSYEELSKGKSEGVALLSKARLPAGGQAGLMLAPEPISVTQVEARCLWPIAAAADGSVYTGSWTDGGLRKTSRDGRTTVLLETKDAGIQAIAVDSGGTVFAAAVPSATIYRIPPGGQAKELCRLAAQNIWGLAAASSGTLWAATGPEGKLYRISPEGTATVAFTAPDRHITALCLGPDDTVYLATSPLGKVYAVPAQGPARSVCELEDAAVQSIGVDAEGNVYVGTSPEAQVVQITRGGSVRELLKVKKAKHMLALIVRPEGTVYAAAGPEAKVYAIYPDGRWAEICDAKTAFVAAMAQGPAAAGGAAGAIYFTAADTGRVIKLDAASERVGRYFSPVHDAGASARWGAVRWRGHCPAGTGVEIWTRSGATAHPDDTWSPWEPVSGEPGAAVPSPPGRFLQCRIDLKGAGAAELQIRAVPQVEVVEVSYLPANRPPEVTITSPKGNEIWSGKQKIKWSGRDPDKDKLTYEVYWSNDSGESWNKIEAPKEPEEKEGEEEKGTAKREGAVRRERTTPSEGEAKAARPARRPAGGPERAGDLSERPRASHPSSAGFVPLEIGDLEEEEGIFPEEDLEEGEESEEPPGGEEGPRAEREKREAAAGPPPVATSRKWDTTKVADGVYWIKVVGSDGCANPDDPRTVDDISGSFLVDNTPPELILDRGRRDDGPAPEEITVFEASTYVTSAEFRVDGGEWLAAVAKDGIFDGQYEALVLSEGRLPEGSHEIEVRVRDAARNVGGAKLRYRR